MRFILISEHMCWFKLYGNQYKISILCIPHYRKQLVWNENPRPRLMGWGKSEIERVLILLKKGR